MNRTQNDPDHHTSVQERTISRREMLSVTAAAIGGTSVLAGWPGRAHAQSKRIIKKGRIKQSICGGCLRRAGLTKDREAALAAEMGVVGMDLVGRKDWDTIKKHGLVATMVSGAGGIRLGLNDKSMHPKFLQDFRKNIDAAAEYNWPNVITMAGDRKGIGDEEGMDNCHTVLREAVKIAEDKGITICMELLNSRVNHPGYMCDKSAWGFELCKRVDSPRFKMLYDIYHMQIMEGDLIATIKKNINHIGHFHTAGVPGRNELDENQEINYPAVMRAIVETGYTGYVAHEYSPARGRDPIKSLIQALETCDV